MNHENQEAGDMSIRDRIAEIDPEMLVLDPEGLDVAIIGIAEGRVVYCVRKLIEALIAVYDFDREGAEEWYDFNIFGAYMGEKTPIYMSRFGDE